VLAAQVPGQRVAALTETVAPTRSGAMLYDRSIISEITEARFKPQEWLHAEPVTGALGSAGRGSTMYVGNVPRQFVLRHFRRGGLLGKFVRDTYLWTGADKTRSFREWRLLAKLADAGLRVPRPAAARYCRKGIFYKADLITVRIPNVQALSVCIRERAQDEKFWMSVGASIRQFHAAGVYHADMNAHNLQIDDQGQLWMLDLDRGRLLAAGPWQQKTLARLHRSLEKIKAIDPQVHYSRENWEQVLEGYFAASRLA